MDTPPAKPSQRLSSPSLQSFSLLLYDKNLNAVKNLNTAASRNLRDAEFIQKVSTISKFQHENVIKLIGYCGEYKQSTAPTGRWVLLIMMLMMMTRACKAKYVDLQQRFYGSTTWFDELLKRRVAELKRALEKSEDSIGLKLTEKGNSDNAEYGSSRSESLPSKLSAGSFTQETETKQVETALVSLSPMKERFMGIDKLAAAIRSEHGVSIRRKRGERKRRFCTKDSSKEGSIGENYLLGLPNGDSHQAGAYLDSPTRKEQDTRS
ncbi:hypothetical protein AKJ16_DCAP20887 [Drosera capensis]